MIRLASEAFFFDAAVAQVPRDPRKHFSAAAELPDPICVCPQSMGQGLSFSSVFSEKSLNGSEDAMQPQQDFPDVSREQRAATDLIKRIRKLRWMGFEEEAQRMVRASLRVCSNDALIAQSAQAR